MGKLIDMVEGEMSNKAFPVLFFDKFITNKVTPKEYTSEFYFPLSVYNPKYVKEDERMEDFSHVFHSNEKFFIITDKSSLINKWYKSTKDTILLHGIGIDEDENLAEISLDKNLFIGENSGGGARNLLESILITCFTEYAPWELVVDYYSYKEDWVWLYNNFPHVENVTISTTRREILENLQNLREEMKKRNKLFVSTGVQSYDEFRNKFTYCKNNKIANSASLPRKLIVIDSVEELLCDINDTELLGTLANLLNEGPNYGYHFILFDGMITYEHAKFIKAHCDLIAVKGCYTRVSYAFLDNDLGDSIYGNKTKVVMKDKVYTVPFISDDCSKVHATLLNYLMCALRNK